MKSKDKIDFMQLIEVTISTFETLREEILQLRNTIEQSSIQNEGSLIKLSQELEQKKQKESQNSQFLSMLEQNYLREVTYLKKEKDQIEDKC